MVNKYFWMPVFAAAAVLAGCAKQEPSLNEKEALQIPGEENVELEEVTINVQAPDSRTYLSGGSVLWSKNDQVTVFDSADRAATSSKVAASGASATITAAITKGSTPVYALYPNDGSASISSGLITTTMATAQTPANTGSFGKHNVAVGALADDGEGGYTSTLKNVCGYLKFTLPKHCSKVRADDDKTYSSTHVSLVTITTTTGNLAGTITIDYNSGTPVITTVSDATKTLTLKPKTYTEKDSGDTFYCSGDYYLVVMPGAYSGITVTLKYDDGTPDYTRSSAGAFSVSRGQYTDLGIFADDVVIMDFTNGNDQLYQGAGDKTYLPDSSRNTDGAWDEWKIDCNGRTYSFGIATWQGVLIDETTYNAVYYYTPSNQALQFTRMTQVMRLPQFDGEALGFIRVLHANSGSKTGTKSINVCTDAGDYGAATPVEPTSAKTLKAVYFNPEERGGADQSAYYWTVNNANLVKGRQWYLNPRVGTNNICVRRLELYYWKID